MKKAVFGFIICLFIFSFFGSCKKSNNSNTVQNSFIWTFGGNTYTASLDSAYEQSIALAPYYIVAINGTNFNTFFTRKIGFSLTSFTPGNYS
ncbi:MAG: hypothetical protein WBB06_04950, partial [Chitinophagaceae bacterium]